MINERMRILMQMTTWMTPKYVNLRLYTMYGSRYIVYILCHPIRFIRDINNYINWCIMMDRHR